MKTQIISPCRAGQAQTAFRVHPEQTALHLRRSAAGDALFRREPAGAAAFVCDYAADWRAPAVATARQAPTKTQGCRRDPSRRGNRDTNRSNAPAYSCSRTRRAQNKEPLLSSGACFPLHLRLPKPQPLDPHRIQMDTPAHLLCSLFRPLRARALNPLLRTIRRLASNQTLIPRPREKTTRCFRPLLQRRAASPALCVFVSL